MSDGENPPEEAPRKPLSDAAKRALAEAAERREQSAEHVDYRQYASHINSRLRGGRRVVPHRVDLLSDRRPL